MNRTHRTNPLTEAPPDRGERLTRLLGGAVIVVAIAAAWSNSFTVPFVFDDLKSIPPENPSAQSFDPWWRPLHPTGQGQATQRRPVANLTIAVNYALGQDDPRGYHAFNFCLHIATALLAYGLVRRTLSSPTLRERFGAHATGWSTAIVLLWAVHPLHVDAVTYVIQRTEVLGSFFYMLVLYSLARAAGSRKQAVGWQWLAVGAGLLGAGSKELIVSVPILALVYDRVFFASRLREAIAKRWRIYAGLLGVWVILATVLPHGHEGTDVFSHNANMWDYLYRQGAVIVHYIRLAFWPAPLVIDYGMFPVSSLQLLLGFIGVLLLLSGVGVALWKYPPLGFAGLLFFAVLAPSSSIIALAQVAAEKRMYLPLLALISIVVLTGRYVLEKIRPRLRLLTRHPRAANILPGLLLLGAVSAELWQTHRVHERWNHPLRLWKHAVTLYPDNWRARNNYAVELNLHKQYADAIRQTFYVLTPPEGINRSLSVNPYQTYIIRAQAFYSLGLYEQAQEALDKARRAGEQTSGTVSYLSIIQGEIYRVQKRYPLAIAAYTRAIHSTPDTVAPQVYNNRAMTYFMLGLVELAWDDIRECRRKGGTPSPSLTRDVLRARNAKLQPAPAG